jgi:hypothetical protein
MTPDDLRRAAERCRDLDDSALMAKAWDEPAPNLQRKSLFGKLIRQSRFDGCGS